MAKNKNKSIQVYYEEKNDRVDEKQLFEVLNILCPLSNIVEFINEEGKDSILNKTYKRGNDENK